MGQYFPVRAISPAPAKHLPIAGCLFPRQMLGYKNFRSVFMMKRSSVLLHCLSIFILCLFSPTLLLAITDAEKAKTHFEEGADLSKQRQFDNAIIEFTQAVRLDPDNPMYHQALVLGYIQTRRGPQAIAFYKDLVKERPQNAQVHYWLGRLYLESQSLESALLEFLESARLTPKDEHPWISLGHVYARLGKEQEALDAYLQANKLSPRIAIVHVGLGNIYYARKQYPKAQKEYEEALKLDGSLTEAKYNLSLIYEKTKEVSKAISLWKSLLEEDPNESRAREKLARAYFLGEQYQDAVQEYMMLSQVRQSSPEVFFALGQSEIMLASTLEDPSDRQQLKELAIHAFQRTLELDPNNTQARKYLDRLQSKEPHSKKPSK